MSSFLDTQSVSFSTKVSRRSIGEFIGYVCLSEDGTDELEITQHPVQRGASITDHAYLKPFSVAIRFIYDANNGKPLDELYQELRQLQNSREPFTIVTGKRVYKDMLFRALSVNTDVRTENVLSVSGDFQQVILVDVEQTNVPVRSKQKIPEKTDMTENKGDKKATPVNEDNSIVTDIINFFRGG